MTTRPINRRNRLNLFAFFIEINDSHLDYKAKHTSVSALLYGALLFALGCSRANFNGDSSYNPAPLPNSKDDSDANRVRNSAESIDDEPNVDSTGDASQNTSSNSNTGSNGEILESVSQTFNLNASITVNVPLDLVWVIDNSGSMEQEVANVRDNLARFVERVSTANVDLKMIFVSKAGLPKTGFKMPDELLAKGHVQLDVSPGDRSVLAAIAAGSCPSNTTVLNFLKPDGKPVAFGERVESCTVQICGKPVSVPACNYADFANGLQIVRGADDGLPWPKIFLQTQPITELSGKIYQQFRADSRKVFVIVSDDDSTVVHDENFVNLIGTSVGKRLPQVFSFSAKTTESMRVASSECVIENYGRSFERLGKALGGASYSICDTNWTPNFDALTTQLTEQAVTDSLYTLTRIDARNIVSATIDGKPVDIKSFTIVGSNLLRIDSAFAAANAGKQLVVQYQAVAK